MSLETVILVVGFSITIATVVYNRGRQDERFDGHEALDVSRFDDIKEDIKGLKADVKTLLTR